MSAIDPSFDLGQTPEISRSPAARELAMLAHDIRGALNGVIGGMGEIEASELSPRLREQVERVATAARSLASLTAMMLGDAPDPVAWASGEHLRLPSFLGYVRSRWAGEAHEKGLGFDIVPATDLPPALRMDHLPLARALGNLISNAIKHTGRGAVRLSVARAPGGGITFRVADDGPGIAADVLDRLSDGVPPSGGVGHGLGLHIVRQIAEQFDGWFTIANREPRGAEAMLHLPASICSDQEPAAPVAATAPTERFALDGLRILLAEDNPTNQMVATQMLRALNAQVAVCADGVEALERFEQEAFDVVVVDIEMPRLSGLDVIRAIRARTDGRSGVPVVALTAYALREHRDRILQAGANGLISKPITSIEALGRDIAAHVCAPQAPAAEPAAAAGDAGPVVDEAIYDALVEAIGREMMAELLDKVVVDLLAARAALSGALEPLDRGPIRSASHILISVAGAIGATRLQSGARCLNAVAHSVADDGIAQQARSCIGEIDSAVAFAREQRGAG
jgi:CheY-like chemotaxis protein/HPt (histidine-containing phosphotransfer) domain-containing protein